MRIPYEFYVLLAHACSDMDKRSLVRVSVEKEWGNSSISMKVGWAGQPLVDPYLTEGFEKQLLGARKTAMMFNEMELEIDRANPDPTGILNWSPDTYRRNVDFLVDDILNGGESLGMVIELMSKKVGE